MQEGEENLPHIVCSHTWLFSPTNRERRLEFHAQLQLATQAVSAFSARAMQLMDRASQLWHPSTTS